MSFIEKLDQFLLAEAQSYKPAVVCFDQLMCALHILCWSELAFCHFFMFFPLLSLILRNKEKHEAKKKKETLIPRKTFACRNINRSLQRSKTV